jgi:bifunctional UDP-N-acetylglucosamine pyrophosphorylase/glucosamine-1-phosphate N-acetyltransferase
MGKAGVSGLSCVVLAAGLGTRMKSSAPKVLHRLLGRSMLHYCLETLSRLRPEKVVVVVSRNKKPVRDEIGESFDISYAVQKQQKGTAHALIAAAAGLRGFKGTVLVTNGDTPLITPVTLRSFLKLHRRHGNAVSLLSFTAEDPTSYGRIIRDEKGNPLRIVEDNDATAEVKAIDEVNSGVYAIETSALPFLKAIRLNRKKGEYYLTDILEIAVTRGAKAGVYSLGDEEEFLGVNTRHDLAWAQEVLRANTVMALIGKGVDFIDPGSAFVEPSVKIGPETVIYPNVYLQGNTTIGRRCSIYPNVRITDSKIKSEAVIKDSTLIESSTVGSGAQVGPFAHIRPESNIGESSKVGNFVEVKKTSIGKGSKAMHLSYLGDATLGKDVNIGAGTITCNYDGTKKHETVIEDGVFVGSDSQLIAPVKVGKDSYVGAGSTITHDVTPKTLAISRTEQVNIKGWPRKKKK